MRYLSQIVLLVAVFSGCSVSEYHSPAVGTTAGADNRTDDLPDKTQEHGDKPVAAPSARPGRTLEESPSALTGTPPQRKTQTPMEDRGGGMKAFGPNGRYVLVENERTKEFLEKAFNVGFLFPDPNPRFAGAIDMRADLLTHEDWRGLVYQYFPSGTFAVINVSAEEGTIIYALSSATDPRRGPLSITGSVDSNPSNAR